MPSWVLRFEHVGCLCLWVFSCFFGCGGGVGQLTEAYTQIFSIPKTADQEAWPKMLQWKLIVGQTNSLSMCNFFDGIAASEIARLRVMRIPCTRPNDFYAEMMRSKPWWILWIYMGWNYQPPVDVFREGHQQSSAKQLGIVLLMTVFRTDKQMYRVRQQAAEEERRIKALALFGWTVNDLEI